MNRLTRLTLLFILIAATPRPARALIAVKLPVADMYLGSRNVIAGTVTKVNPETGAVTASFKVLKGELAGDVIRFKIEGLPTVLASVKEGSPFVLLTGRKPENYALHLADTWLLPEPDDKPTLFAIRKERDLRQSYPGTTSALLKIVQAKAADKYDMLDKVSDETSKSMFHGGVKDLGKLDPAGATRLFGFTAGKRPLVLAATKASVKIFSPQGGTIVPDGRAPEVGIPAADFIGMGPASPGAGMMALTRSGALLTFDGKVTPEKTVQLWSDNTTASAAAIGTFGEDPDKLYAIVIKDDNVYRYALDGQSPPADFLRMTGERITTYHQENPKWLAGATAAALDVNGDGKLDLLINTPSGPLLLINRGYGAFFIDADIAKILKSPDGNPLITDKSLWTATDLNADGLDDLVIVSESGAVTAVMNAKPTTEGK